MSNPLIRKLECSGFLDEADRAVLGSIATDGRTVMRHQDLIREGDRPENVLLVLKGFACRYKMMPGGRRQIMALLVPGDFCDLHVAILKEMDHGISTLSPCTIVDIPHETILNLTTNHTRIARALWWATLTDEATLREWLANMGQRNASRQMAHLFCELLIRLRTVGFATHNTFDFPLTQYDLGDILGKSNVHVNRMMQDLRERGLISFIDKRLKIPDVARLEAFCDFNGNYLHIMRCASKY
ncbi:Crp/Fnr family transcriptional regulator [Methylobacterium oryzisoli]|uniref:Crp/Fnr family transcriptional regulator n=2 Tax=Methylobacterium oryzisoli TaxID=3385502 RepID=UPI0038919746